MMFKMCDIAEKTIKLKHNLQLNQMETNRVCYCVTNLNALNACVVNTSRRGRAVSVSDSSPVALVRIRVRSKLFIILLHSKIEVVIFSKLVNLNSRLKTYFSAFFKVVDLD